MTEGGIPLLPDCPELDQKALITAMPVTAARALKGGQWLEGRQDLQPGSTSTLLSATDAALSSARYTDHGTAS